MVIRPKTLEQHGHTGFRRQITSGIGSRESWGGIQIHNQSNGFSSSRRVVAAGKAVVIAEV